MTDIAGEGETCGVPVEAAMDTVAAIDIVKGRPTPWPRLESDTHLMSTGSGPCPRRRVPHRPRRPRVLDGRRVRARSARRLSAADAGQRIAVANVVDPNYTFLTKVRKEYLPRVDPYDGVHARLRGTAVRSRG